MEQNANDRRSFLHGAVILGLAGILCKVIGALYRIPLTNLIGVEAMGVYAKAYLIYSLLWVVCTSGLPVAVSKLVSSLRAQGDLSGAHAVFLASRRVLGALGVVFCVLMTVFSGSIAASLGIPSGRFAIVCIAPCMLLTVVSAYRGYFQGMQNMAPTAVSQLIGSAGKLFIGLALAALWLPEGPVYAAGGALLGVTLSELSSIVYIHFRYLRCQKNAPAHKPVQNAQRGLYRQLFNAALPVTIGGAVLPLVNMLDAYLVTWCLHAAGYEESHINSMYGVLNGMVSSLVNVPAVVTVALAAALVPFISAAYARKQDAVVSRSVCTALKLALCVGLPCFAGMLLLGKPVLNLFYHQSVAETAALFRLIPTLKRAPYFVFDKLSLGGSMMQICGFSVLFLSVSQTATGILQGTGRFLAPMRSIAIGAAVKIILSIFLLQNARLNILGAPISSAVCYGVTAVLNLLSLRRVCSLKRAKFIFAAPLAASAIMSAVLWGARTLLNEALMKRSVILAVICLAAVLYLLLLLLFRAFSPQELALFPGGKRICAFLQRLSLRRNKTNEKEGK